MQFVILMETTIQIMNAKLGIKRVLIKYKRKRILSTTLQGQVAKGFHTVKLIIQGEEII